MKKTVKKITALILASIMILTAFSGCNSRSKTDNSDDNSVVETQSGTEAKSDEAINLTVVLGKTRNNLDPDLALISSAIDQLAEYGGSLTVVLDDGDPAQNFYHTEISAPDKTKTTNVRKKQALNTKNRIVMSLSTLMPKADGTNTLKALKVAADNTPRDGKPNKLVVFDSGLQTEGVFQMEDLGVVNSRKDDILIQLKSGMNIPSFEIYSDIKWYGLGQTCGEQPTPTDADIVGLKSYYLSLLQSSDYKVTDADALFSTVNYQATNADHSEYPEVRTIIVSDDVIKIEPASDTEAEPQELPQDTNLTFSEDLFGFEPNTAKLINPNEAKNNAKKAAEFLNSYDGAVIIVGTTSHWGSADTSIELSLSRSETIADILVELGVDRDRIQCYGGGYSDKDLVINDLDSNGKLIESLAVANRSVHLLSANHEFAKKYIDGTFKP